MEQRGYFSFSTRTNCSAPSVFEPLRSNHRKLSMASRKKSHTRLPVPTLPHQQSPVKCRVTFPASCLLMGSPNSSAPWWSRASSGMDTVHFQHWSLLCCPGASIFLLLWLILGSFLMPGLCRWCTTVPGSSWAPMSQDSVIYMAPPQRGFPHSPCTEITVLLYFLCHARIICIAFLCCSVCSPLQDEFSIQKATFPVWFAAKSQHLRDRREALSRSLLSGCIAEQLMSCFLLALKQLPGSSHMPGPHFPWPAGKHRTPFMYFSGRAHFLPQK